MDIVIIIDTDNDVGTDTAMAASDSIGLASAHATASLGPADVGAVNSAKSALNDTKSSADSEPEPEPNATEKSSLSSVDGRDAAGSETATADSLPAAAVKAIADVDAGADADADADAVSDEAMDIAEDIKALEEEDDEDELPGGLFSADYLDLRQEGPASTSTAPSSSSSSSSSCVSASGVRALSGWSSGAMGDVPWRDVRYCCLCHTTTNANGNSNGYHQYRGDAGNTCYAGAPSSSSSSSAGAIDIDNSDSTAMAPSVDDNTGAMSVERESGNIGGSPTDNMVDGPVTVRGEGSGGSSTHCGGANSGSGVADSTGTSTVTNTGSSSSSSSGSSYDDDPVCGRLLPLPEGQCAHVNCLRWSAEVVERAGGLLTNALQAVKR
jgi:hypothetical protein